LVWIDFIDLGCKGVQFFSWKWFHMFTKVKGQYINLFEYTPLQTPKKQPTKNTKEILNDKITTQKKSKTGPPAWVCWRSRALLVKLVSTTPVALLPTPKSPKAKAEPKPKAKAPPKPKAKPAPKARHL